MEETSDVSKVDDEEVEKEIQGDDFCHRSEEHEYMFIEKEEPEFDESEDLGSLVNEVLLQSAELVERDCSISDELQVLEEPQMVNLEQDVPPRQSSPPEKNAMSTCDAVSPLVTTSVTTETTETQVSKTSSVQTQPRAASLTSSTTTQASHMRSGQFSVPTFIQMNTLQNAMYMQNMVANVLQRMGSSQIDTSNRGFSQPVPHSSNSTNNFKNMNCLRMGPRPGTSVHPVQDVPRTLLMAQIRAQMARFGIPQHNLRMASTTSLPQNIHQSARVPRLTHVPPATSVQQTSIQTAQLNLMKNLGIPLQRPRLPTPMRNISQLNAFQNASNLERVLQMQKTSASQVGMQRFVPVSSALQNVKQATSMGSTQTHIQGSGVSRSLGSSQISPSIRNCSQFRMPQFCSPQLVANALQLRVPVGPRIFLRPPISSHQVIPPQPRVPHLNVGLRQNVTSNVQRLSIPHVVNSGPRVGVTPLSTNVQRLNVPQIAASVPRINATQITGPVPRGMLPLSTSQMSRSINQPLIPPNITQVGMPRFKVPLLSSNIPSLPVPQTGTKLTQPRLQTGVTNFLQSPARTSSANPVEMSPEILRQIWTKVSQLSQSELVQARRQGMPSTSATSYVARASTSQTSSACMAKTPARHWESTSMNLDSNLQRTSQDVVQNIPKNTGTSTLEVTDLQQQQETVGNSQQSDCVLQPTENLKLGASDSTVHQKSKQRAKTPTMKKHLKHQLAFLKLWKKFEKYNFKCLNNAHKKKLIEAQKRHRLLRKKNKTILSHKNIN